MLLENQHPHNKSIMVSLLGAPNVGKSSLVNYLLGLDLSVVTHKPQTTRNRINCVLTIDRTEIVLIDTPGLHKSNHEFNKRLNQQARDSLEGSDLNLLLIDISKAVMGQFADFKSLLDRDLGETWVVFTKSDKVENSSDLPLQDIIEKAKEFLPTITEYFLVSAQTGDNMHLLTTALNEKAQPGPHFYEDGAVSNKNERFFAGEYIREQAFQLLKDELPYEIAVLIEDFHDVYLPANTKSKKRARAKISACILVNRPSQRAIVVGAKGSMIKQIGMNSRKKIEAMVGVPVDLNLHVKVSPRWHKNNYVLEELGLPRAINSNRVWKARD